MLDEVKTYPLLSKHLTPAPVPSLLSPHIPTLNTIWTRCCWHQSSTHFILIQISATTKNLIWLQWIKALFCQCLTYCLTVYDKWKYAQWPAIHVNGTPNDILFIINSVFARVLFCQRGSHFCTRNFNSLTFCSKNIFKWILWEKWCQCYFIIISNCIIC